MSSLTHINSCLVYIQLHLCYHPFTGFEKIVQMLIDRGAGVNAVTDDKNSALIFASSNGNILKIFNCGYRITFDFIVTQ